MGLVYLNHQHHTDWQNPFNMIRIGPHLDYLHRGMLHPQPIQDHLTIIIISHHHLCIMFVETMDYTTVTVSDKLPCGHNKKYLYFHAALRGSRRYRCAKCDDPECNSAFMKKDKEMAQTIRKVLTVEEAKAKQRETIEVELDTLISLFEKELLVNLCYTYNMENIDDYHRRSLIFREIQIIFQNAGWKVTRYQNNSGRDTTDSLTITAE